MRLQLAALALAAGLAPAAVAPHEETLYTSPPHRPISAFAQDGSVVAWFAPGARDCNSVHLLSLDTGGQVSLPAQGESAPNVTCRWGVVPPVRLALAGTDALWTLREQAPLRFDYVLGAGQRDPAERRFQEIAHGARGAGLWLGGIAGDGGTLVYGVTSVDFVDEVGCLAGTGPCDMRVKRPGGGVYRVVGRKPPVLVPGTKPAFAVAASGGAVAYVPTGSVAPDGRPQPSAAGPIEVRNAVTGRLVSRVRPRGVPIALALAPHVLATLERTKLGLRLAWYARATGAPTGSVPVPAATDPELSASDQLLVFHVGRTIRAVDVPTHAVRTLGRSAAAPIGLSVEGSRVAWAENVNGRGRIRAVYPAGRG